MQICPNFLVGVFMEFTTQIYTHSIHFALTCRNKHSDFETESGFSEWKEMETFYKPIHPVSHHGQDLIELWTNHWYHEQDENASN